MQSSSHVLMQQYKIFSSIKFNTGSTNFLLAVLTELILLVISRAVLTSCEDLFPTKPYSHQVERAKDLLGLIHIAVEKTPYEILHEQAPKLSYLKVLGCEALVKRDTLTKPDKLEPRSIKCIFVGYPKETMVYSFYYPPENKVFISRNAEFFESNLIDQEVSGSLEDLEIIQEEDTNPSLYTSLNHEEDDK
ncbi:retrotransposon protein, putative, ty1-copia subclass [Tanacetum coccineum]